MTLKAPFPWSESFWSKVDRSGECWLWKAAKTEKGYGVFGIGGKTFKAHRVAYEMEHGSIPEGLCLLHVCDTPACVRPLHLRPGTKAENNADMRRKGRNAPGGSKTPRESCAYQRGEQHHEAKLDKARVLAIRADYDSGNYSMSQIATKYGIGLTTAFKVIRRVTWQSV